MSLRPRKLARPWAKMPRCYWPTRTPSEKFILMPTTKWWTFIQVNNYIFRVFPTYLFWKFSMIHPCATKYYSCLVIKSKFQKKIDYPTYFILKILKYQPFSIIHSCAAMHYSCLSIVTSFDRIKTSKFAKIGIKIDFDT